MEQQGIAGQVGHRDVLVVVDVGWQLHSGCSLQPKLAPGHAGCPVPPQILPGRVGLVVPSADVGTDAPDALVLRPAAIPGAAAGLQGIAGPEDLVRVISLQHDCRPAAVVSTGAPSGAGLPKWQDSSGGGRDCGPSIVQENSCRRTLQSYS